MFDKIGKNAGTVKFLVALPKTKSPTKAINSDAYYRAASIGRRIKIAYYFNIFPNLFGAGYCCRWVCK